MTQPDPQIPEVLKNPWWRRTGALVGLVLFAGLAAVLASRWQELPSEVLDPNWPQLICAFAILLASLGDPEKRYGGLCWLNRGGDLPRAPADTYYAAGWMGQYTVIIPSLDMVVVRLGPSPANSRDYLNDIIGEIRVAVDR